jgi:phosphoribosyl 1,2-cyclic phosphodiesterase
MRLTFLGTRGYIEARTPRHRMHSALLVAQGGGAVLIDCGEDWAGRLAALRPRAVLVTHAHPDHAGGLRGGAPCPVWATTPAWRSMARFAIAARDRRLVVPGRRWRVAGLTFEAFPVVHSLRAPAVGYRIGAGGVRVFYVPDVLAIPAHAAVLARTRLYVGDGASLVRPIVRRRGRRRFGHAPIREQLAWCRAAGVREAVFTHCGSQIVAGDARRSEARVAVMAAAYGIEARVAHDGMTLDLGGRAAERRHRAST